MRRLYAYAAAALLAGLVGWLASRRTPAYVLEITMASSVDGVAQCYFDHGSGLSEADSLRLPVRASAEPARLRFPLPVTTYTGIRFDPLDREGDVRIASVEVRDGSGHAIARIAPRHITPLNEVEMVPPTADGTLALHCRGADPQVQLPLDHPLALSTTVASMAAPAGLALLIFSALVGSWELIRAPRVREAAAAVAQRFAPIAHQSTPLAGIATGAVVVATLATEICLFLSKAAPRYAAVNPRWNDQIQYLSEAYTAHEFSRQHGFWRAVLESLVNPSAQGTLHDVYTTFVFAFTGPSRVAALSLNLVALVGWQVANFIAARRVSRSWAVAIVASLIPALGTWQWQDLPGSAFDFRLDHLAMCLLGITAALALIAAHKPSVQWSVAAGLAAGTLIAARFLTATYIVGGVIIALALYAATKRRRPAISLGIAALTCGAVSGPVLFLNRHVIYNYYVVGHYFGEESRIRNQHYGLLKSISYVLQGALMQHGGTILLTVLGASLAAAVLHVARTRRAEVTEWKTIGLVGAIFTAVPLAVLTLHAQKSPVVLGALLPGVIWLVVAGFAAGRRLFTGFGPLFATSVAVLTLATVTVRLSHAAPPYEAIALSREVTRLADLIFRDSHAQPGARPSIATDHITDSVDAQVFRVLTYEARHTWIDYEMSLSGIGTPRETDVMAAFARSDYLIVTRRGGTENWPFDTALKALRPALLAWCEQHGTELGTFDLAGRQVAVFRNRHQP